MSTDERAPGKAAKKTVLVVDDDEFFLRIVADMLEDLGFEVVTAPDAETGLEHIGRQLPDAALVDGVLPGMQGDEMVRLLRNKHPPDELPIVFISAYFRDARSCHYLLVECGVNAVLHKPVTQAELARALGPVLDETIADGEHDLRGPVRDLVPGYLRHARERIDAMARALAALGGPEERDSREFMRLEAHRIRGTSGCFGLAELTRIAGELEQRLVGAPPQPLAAEQRAEVTGLVQALAAKTTLARARFAPEDASVEPAPFQVGLLDGDTALAASCWEAQVSGQPVRVFTDLDDAVARARALAEAANSRFAPRAALPPAFAVGADLSGFDGLRAARRLVECGAESVMLVCAPGSLTSRLELLRAGIRGLFPRPPDAQSLLELATMFAPRPPGASIVAVSPPGERLRELGELLAHSGVALEPCGDPEELLQVLASSEPSLLLVASSPRQCSPLELVSVVRADPAWRNLPVLLVTDGAGMSSVEALRAGADDLIDRSASPAQLASRVLAHLERAARQRRETLIDPISGTSVPPYFYRAAAANLSLARRGHGAAFLVLDIDPAWLGSEEGRVQRASLVGALGGMLRGAFRGSDLLARLGPARFAVLLNDISDRDARVLLAKVVSSWREQRRIASAGTTEGPELRGGVASYPEVVGGIPELMGAALADLSRSPKEAA